MRKIFVFVCILNFISCSLNKEKQTNESLLVNKQLILKELSNHQIGYRDDLIILNIVFNEGKSVSCDFMKNDSITSFEQIKFSKSISMQDIDVLTQNLFIGCDSLNVDSKFKKYVFDKIKLMRKLQLISVNSNRYEWPVDIFTLSNGKVLYYINDSIKYNDNKTKYVLKNVTELENNWYISN